MKEPCFLMTGRALFLSGEEGLSLLLAALASKERTTSFTEGELALAVASASRAVGSWRGGVRGDGVAEAEGAAGLTETARAAEAMVTCADVCAGVGD